jgi:hypothetical protein
MQGMIRTLALGAVLAAGAATGAMAQGVNNTGYDRAYYGDPGYYWNRDVYMNRGAFGYGAPGYGYYGYYRGYPAGAVAPRYAHPYDYDGRDPGYGASLEPGWGFGGAYDPAYNRPYGYPYNYPYWGR